MTSFCQRPCANRLLVTGSKTLLQSIVNHGACCVFLCFLMIKQLPHSYSSRTHNSPSDITDIGRKFTFMFCTSWQVIIYFENWRTTNGDSKPDGPKNSCSIHYNVEDNNMFVMIMREWVLGVSRCELQKQIVHSNDLDVADHHVNKLTSKFGSDEIFVRCHKAQYFWSNLRSHMVPSWILMK